MESLLIEGTKKTPFISCDARSGQITIKGRSIPENPYEFYKPINNWIEKQIKEKQNIKQVDIHLEYFNTSTSKCLLDLLIRLREYYKTNKEEFVINWYYENEDSEMLEAGSDYESIVKIPFRMIEVCN